MISRFQISRSIVTQLQLGISERQEKCISLPFFLSLVCIDLSACTRRAGGSGDHFMELPLYLLRCVLCVCVCVCVCVWVVEQEWQTVYRHRKYFSTERKELKEKRSWSQTRYRNMMIFQWPCSDKLWMHDDRQLNAASIPPPLSLSLSLSAVQSWTSNSCSLHIMQCRSESGGLRRAVPPLTTEGQCVGAAAESTGTWKYDLILMRR